MLDGLWTNAQTAHKMQSTTDNVCIKWVIQLLLLLWLLQIALLHQHAFFVLAHFCTGILCCFKLFRCISTHSLFLLIAAQKHCHNFEFRGTLVFFQQSHSGSIEELAAVQFPGQHGLFHLIDSSPLMSFIFVWSLLTAAQFLDPSMHTFLSATAATN